MAKSSVLFAIFICKPFYQFKMKQEIPKSQDSDLMILSGGQTLLICLTMVSAFGLSFMIFIAELINFKLENVMKNLSKKKKKKLKKTFPKIIVHSKSVNLSNINE
jgi:hypothetical protein